MTVRISRRDTLKAALVGAGAGVLPYGFHLHAQNPADDTQKLCVFVQANGGWDPTSFCDPKMNSSGERIINNWANSAETQEIGNIRYAPFESNKLFFEKYHDRMLVINGVDAQTNSHTVGVVHNWSGVSSEGYPTSTAMYAGEIGSGLTIPYLSYGGYSVTGGLTRFTRIRNPNLIRNIAVPSQRDNSETRYLTEDDWSAIEAFAQRRAEQQGTNAGILPSRQRHLDSYQSSYAADGLKDFADAISEAGRLEGRESERGYSSFLRTQAQLTVLAFKTGAAVSADLFLGGFDTHDQHDTRQGAVIYLLTAGVDYLWDYAEAHGVADRMFVVIGSDFGRTNFYNADQGKDHWPIGSYVIMEKNQPWTNRMVGYTDDLHFAQRTNPATLERDNLNGTIIYPKHVHKAIREYLGLDSTAGAQQFPFNNTEDFNFFRT